MIKLVVNLIMFFNEQVFFDCFEVVVCVGFCGVEFLFFYVFYVDQIVDCLNCFQFDFVLYNLLVGNWDGGECGIVILLDCVSEFQDGVGEVIKYVKVFGVKQFNCLVGICFEGVSEDVVCKMFVENLRFVVKVLKVEKIDLLIELINMFDILGFYLNCMQQVLDLINDVDVFNLYVQYDIYYM